MTKSAFEIEQTVDGEGRTVATLRGSIDERAQLAAVATTLQPPIIVDLEAVNFINSLGVTDWIRFVRALTERGSVKLVRCSETMVRLFNMVTGAGGRETVESFAAPYVCDDCGREEPHVLAVTPEIVAWRTHSLPTFGCVECGGKMRFGDVPDRYLAFLTS